MAIDQGTTSSRVVIVDRGGQIVANDQAEFEQFYPHPGWVEHDPNIIWNNVQRVLAGALIDGGIKPNQIKGIGISNQRETTIVWNRHTGEPIYRAIVWQSRQTADIAQDLLNRGYGTMIQEKTGLIPDAYFSATKIRWILDRVPGAQEAAEAGDIVFGTIDTWLLWKLTDGQAHMTDYANASRTMLLNIHSLDWDQDILDLLDIPRKMLPELRSNSEIYAYTQSYHFFNHEVPVAAMIGDQQASLFGHMAFQPGMVKATYGTGSFIIMNTGTQLQASNHKLLSTVAYVLKEEVHYALEGSIFVAGSAIQWLRDGLELFQDASESEAYAWASQSQDEIYLVPAFTGLGTPYWNSAARGAIFGLSRGTNKNDLTKATLQALAYQVRDVIDTMEIDSGIEISSLQVDGGAGRNSYLMQFQADILGKHIRRAQAIETTALGAAYLAGLALGFWQDLNEIQDLHKESQDFLSNISEGQRNRLYRGWKEAVQATEYYTKLVETRPSLEE